MKLNLALKFLNKNANKMAKIYRNDEDRQKLIKQTGKNMRHY